MKKLTCLGLSVVLMLAVAGGVCHAQTAINTLEQLQAMTIDGNYILGNDIDAYETETWNGGEGFEPIGTEGEPFTGTFDGNGKEINWLHINRPAVGFVGLFGNIDTGAEVKNVCLTGVNIKGGGVVGALAGRNMGTISNSYATGSVGGNCCVGGLIGGSTGIVTTSYYLGSVDGHGVVGGLVGGNWGAVSNSRAAATVVGVEVVGGLIGGGGGTVENSYSTGSVVGVEEIGGLMGANLGTVQNTYATGSASGTDHVGGLIGTNEGVIATSYSMGSVSSSAAAGGLVGSNLVGLISKSFYDRDTSGQSDTGKGEPKTTEEMKTKSTFTDAGWDFGNIWNISGDVNEGYPFFRWRWQPDDKSSGCFIAGAAYGTGSVEVGVLRGFRDGFLAGNTAGRVFTKTYYRVSPAFAEVISENKALSFIARAHLTPFVRAADFLTQ